MYSNVLVSDVLDRFILYRKIKKLVLYLEKMIKLIQRGRMYDQDYKRGTGSKRVLPHPDIVLHFRTEIGLKLMNLNSSEFYRLEFLILKILN